MPKTLTPFTVSYPKVQDTLILDYLTFRELNQLVEHQQDHEMIGQEAEEVLVRSNPSFINLKEKKAQGDFAALIDNIKTRVLPTVGLKRIELEAEAGSEAAYKELCGYVGHHLHQLIRNEFYPFKVQTKLEAQTVRDCLFHYCQHDPAGAGKLMNQHVWKFWNSFTTDCLIEYGAHVNAKFNAAAYPTLFQALRWSASAYTVQRLIEAGADYTAYRETRQGIDYTLMLVAAFGSASDVLAVMVEKFPQEVAATLQTLDTMLSHCPSTQYSCQFNDRALLTDNKSEKKYYEYQEIFAAKMHLLLAANQNCHRHTFVLSGKDKNDLLLYVHCQLSTAATLNDCLNIFKQHIHANYIQNSQEAGYSAEKIKLIEMVQQRIVEIFAAERSKKENRVNDNYYQHALAVSQHAVFSPEHVQQGVAGKYIKAFAAGLRNHAADLEYVARKRRRVEERLHYVPSRNNLFQVQKSPSGADLSVSLDDSDNLKHGMTK